MWLRRKPGERGSAEGFALVEVLVAAAVAAVLLAALMRAFSSVWSGIGAVREETAAMLVARAVIEASTPRMNLTPLTQEGMSGQYAWSVSVVDTGLRSASGQETQQEPSLLSTPGQPNSGQTDADEEGISGDQQEQRENREPPWSLFRIAVVVRAPSGRRTSIETFRLSRPAAR